MRILVNDHAGHPFQVQLSRSLAARGYEVFHTYCGKLQTPRADLLRRADDPPGFNVRPIDLVDPFDRYGMISRWRQERELGRLLGNAVKAFRPDVVISANTPLGTQAALQQECRKSGSKFIFWLQDLLGIGISKNLSRKLHSMGKAIGRYYSLLEERVLSRSDMVIAITEDFVPVLDRGRVPRRKIRVVPNWAPIDQIPVVSKVNPWSVEQGIDRKFCFLYAGTLGMKHNPALLVDLAGRMAPLSHVEVVVLSEGLGAEYILEQKKLLGLNNIRVLPFQPFETLPFALASADVLVAILEEDAGIFSVPSKVLTYLCTDRPLLLAVPPENQAARLVAQAGAGFVVCPSDRAGFLGGASKMVSNPEECKKMGSNGLRYAEKAFCLNNITNRFEKIILNTLEAH